MTLYDSKIAFETICEAAGNEVDAIYGVALNENLGEEIIVTVIATGFDEALISGKSNTSRIKMQTTSTQPSAPKPVEEVKKEEDGDLPSFFRNRK